MVPKNGEQLLTSSTIKLKHFFFIPWFNFLKILYQLLQTVYVQTLQYFCLLTDVTTNPWKHKVAAEKQRSIDFFMFDTLFVTQPLNFMSTIKSGLELFDFLRVIFSFYNEVPPADCHISRFSDFV